MTAYALKRLYERNNPNGHFFDRETMRFFGDTMRNFGVRDAGERLVVSPGAARKKEMVDLCLLYRKRPTKRNMRGELAYFRKDNGKEIAIGD
jgi:hypothetical protein